jgi:hypothetical protein
VNCAPAHLTVDEHRGGIAPSEHERAHSMDVFVVTFPAQFRVSEHAARYDVRQRHGGGQRDHPVDHWKAHDEVHDENHQIGDHGYPGATVNLVCGCGSKEKKNAHTCNSSDRPAAKPSKMREDTFQTG